MKVYTIEEYDYNELEETLECMIDKAKDFLRKMDMSEMGYRNRMGWRDEDDDYDWKIKKGRGKGRY